MPNSNRYDILSISIFCQIPLSISIFKCVLVEIYISRNGHIYIDSDINIFPIFLINIFKNFFWIFCKYQYSQKVCQYFINILSIFKKKCRFIHNWYGLSINRTPLVIYLKESGTFIGCDCIGRFHRWPPNGPWPPATIKYHQILQHQQYFDQFKKEDFNFFYESPPPP